MLFANKSLLAKSPSRVRTMKYMTMFFLGTSCVIFATKAFNITPITSNAIIYIRDIFLTASGNNNSATGIKLE
jgi:hypothetical protein